MTEMAAPSRRSPVDQSARDAAIKERARNVLIDAGAGTGKTTTLVARLVEMVAPSGTNAPSGMTARSGANVSSGANARSGTNASVPAVPIEPDRGDHVHAKGRG